MRATKQIVLSIYKATIGIYWPLQIIQFVLIKTILAKLGTISATIADNFLSE